MKLCYKIKRDFMYYIIVMYYKLMYVLINQATINSY